MLATKLNRLISAGLFGCLAALSFSGPASAGCLSQSLGAVTVHNCNGKVGWSQTVGGITVHSFDGKLGTSQTVGATTMHNFDGKVGWSQTVGGITVHSGPLFDDR